MHFFRITTATAILLLLGSSSPLKIAAQELRPVLKRQSVPLQGYTDSADDLKTFIQAIFAATKSGDTQKTSRYFSSLIIPDHTAWFLKMFGPAEGPRLDATYTELLPHVPDEIERQFESALKAGRTQVVVSLLQKPVDPGVKLSRAIAIIDAMSMPAPLYSADTTGSKEEYALASGYLVYIDGGFRYIDSEVFQELSTAPPLRIKMGGNVVASNLLNKVNPAYPVEARQNRIQGSVRLHVIIGTDGLIKDVELIQGHPVFEKAAIDAIRQWRYRPVMLNGKPAEVDTTISVVFSLDY